MTARVLVLGLLLGACSELPELEDDVCGNFVLDPNEDCDDSSASCVECSLACDVSVDEAGEPVESCSVGGYVCGVDGFCHAPSGEFAEVGTVAFRGRDLIITDVDGDGIGDVLGLADNAISINYGDFAGSLADAVSTLTPQRRGEPAFTDLDGDDSLDVLLPTADGIAGYSSPSTGISPHSFAFDLREDPSCTESLNQPFHVFSIDDRNLGVLTILPFNKLGLAVVPADNKTVCPTQVVPLCDVAVGNPMANPPGLDVYPTAPPANEGKVLAIRVAGGICVVAAQKATPASTTYDFVNITPPGIGLGAPILADFDGTGCPSIVLSALGPSLLREHVGLRSGGDCALAALPSLLPNLAALAPPDVRAVGHLELAPRITGFGKDALVLESGVFAIRSDRAGAIMLYHADRRLSLVQAGDLDRDGDIDGVAISTTPTNGVEDIDVLTRTSAGAFLLRRIDTADPISNFVVGDYDGDEVDDVAFTEKLATGERLLVSFGSRDLPIAPVEFGTFDQIVGLCPIQITDSLDLQNTVQDLVVLDILGDNPLIEVQSPVVTVLHGSPQRTLLSFIDPRSTFGSRSQFGGVAAGNFFDTAGYDVLALELTDANLGALWPMRGAEIGELTTTGSSASAIGPCANRTLDELPQFCGDTGHYIPWRLGDREVVIGIDDPSLGAIDADGNSGVSERNVVVIDPRLLIPSTGPMPSLVGQTYLDWKDLTIGAPVPLGLRVRSMVPVDFEGTGDRALAVAFIGTVTGVIRGEVRLCEIDDVSARPTTCVALATRVPALAGWTCVDAAAAQLAPRGRDLPVPHAGSDLLVLCHGRAVDGVPDVTRAYRVFHDAATGTDAAEVLAEMPRQSSTRILAGDVTGDALDDIVILELGVPASALRVIRQCAISDLDCKNAAVTIGASP